MATITGSNVVLSNQEYNVVGTRPIRQDGAEKVTGRARYGADVSLPGLLHARVLRSPHAHARIKSIDTSKAEAMEGVRGVVTAADLPQPQGRISDQTEASMVNPKFLSNNCLADDKVLYKGHAVAAVAAISPHIAEKALELIDVEYEITGLGYRCAGGHEAGGSGAARTVGKCRQSQHADRRPAG